MSENGQLTDWLHALLDKLTPQARRKLARSLTTTLRQSQQKRITAQKNPDGSAYTPRLPQLRSKKGRVRRAMFNRLRMARYLKTQNSPRAAVVVFSGKVQRIARVHQFGLRDKVRDGVTHQYVERRLLGLSKADIEAVQDTLLDHLSTSF